MEKKKKLISGLRYGRWRGVKQADRREASETENRDRRRLRKRRAEKRGIVGKAAEE